MPLDDASPGIVRVAPLERYLATGSFEIRYQYRDLLTDIDPDGVEIAIDDVARTAEAIIDDAELTLDLTGARSLSDRDYEVFPRVPDVQGNVAERLDRIGVDLVYPVAEFTAPGANALVNTNRPLVMLEYADSPGAGGFASGIEPADETLTEDGGDVSEETARDAAWGVYQPPAERPLSEGLHEYRGVDSDRARRTVERVRRFTVDTVPHAP